MESGDVKISHDIFACVTVGFVLGTVATACYNVTSEWTVSRIMHNSTYGWKKSLFSSCGCRSPGQKKEVSVDGSIGFVSQLSVSGARHVTTPTATALLLTFTSSFYRRRIYFNNSGVDLVKNPCAAIFIGAREKGRDTWKCDATKTAEKQSELRVGYNTYEHNPDMTNEETGSITISVQMKERIKTPIRWFSSSPREKRATFFCGTTKTLIINTINHAHEAISKWIFRRLLNCLIY